MNILNLKIQRKGGEEKMKRMTILCLAISMLLCMTSLAIAGTDWASPKTFTVTVVVPSLTTGMNGDVSKVVTTQANCATAPTYGWTKGQTALNFGTLTPDPVNNIFKGGYAFAIDVGVLNNVAAGWTITNTATHVTNGTNFLDNNINVTFQYTTGTLTDPGTTIAARSYANIVLSGQPITKSQIPAGNFLRIWYGIGTGNKVADQCTDDNSGVSPIGFSQPYGTYMGTITLTLVAT